MMPPAIRRLWQTGRLFLLATLPLLTVVILSGAAVMAYAKATQLAAHIVDVRQKVDDWLGDLLDAETGARGYVASGDEAFLEPYDTAMIHERTRAAAVRRLVVGDSTARGDGDVADRDALATMAYLGELVAQVKMGHQRTAIALLASGEEKQHMDAFRRDVQAIRASETNLLVGQRAIAESAARRGIVFSVVFVLLSGATLALGWRREHLHQRFISDLAERALHRLNALSDLATSLAEVRTSSEVAPVVVEQGMRAASADTCTLYLLEASGTALDLIEQRGVAPEILAKIRHISPSAGNPDVFKRMERGASTWAENEADYARLYPGLAATPSNDARAKAFWSVPLVAEGKSLGLLGAGYYQARKFPPEERRFIETLAGHCAQALLRAARLEREDEARGWLNTTLRSIGDAVIATDGKGDVTFMNPVAETLTGWSEAESRGRALDQVFCIFSEKTREVVENPVTKVLREGMIIGLANHTMLRSKSGSEIPIDDSGAPIRSESGEIRGVVMVFRDVTREKREHARNAFLAAAGEALVSSIDYPATLATVAKLAVPTLADWCAVDLVEPDTKIVRQVAVAHVDEAKVRLARTLGERYPPNPDDPGGVAKVLRTGRSELYTEIPQELLEQSARDAEHLRIIRDLHLKSAMVVPLRGREQTLGAITFVYADSGRHYAGEDLSFAEDFARRATMAIENARAVKEKDEARMREQVLRSAAELANRAKDEFLATVSHELRTPLTAILGWAVLLRRRNLSPEIDRRLATIERNARLQAKLIEDVLDISRIMSGKLALNFGATKMRDTIISAIEVVTPAAEAKSVAIIADLPDEDVPILADSDRLQQVVWNLLSNAVKFTPKGGRVLVRMERRPPDVCIVVSDSGEGIRRNVLPFLFEPFWQADASTTRRHGGLGLGLSIVRQLVVAHGGTVKADSDGEGKGATFTVLLPERTIVKAVSETEPAESASAMTFPVDKAPTLRGIRVLLVDDEPDALELVSEVLRAQGADVMTAISAQQALALLPNARPHVLVSDISMPDMDGLDLIRALRERTNDQGGQTPAIALTAFTRNEDVERALAAGFQTHLFKPVDVVSLTEAVARLGKRGQVSVAP
jgi:PAS domain S-box-containing protein